MQPSENLKLTFVQMMRIRENIRCGLQDVSHLPYVRMLYGKQYICCICMLYCVRFAQDVWCDTIPTVAFGGVVAMKTTQPNL